MGCPCAEFPSSLYILQTDWDLSARGPQHLFLHNYQSLDKLRIRGPALRLKSITMKPMRACERQEACACVRDSRLPPSFLMERIHTQHVGGKIRVNPLNLPAHVVRGAHAFFGSSERLSGRPMNLLGLTFLWPTDRGGQERLRVFAP